MSDEPTPQEEHDPLESAADAASDFLADPSADPSTDPSNSDPGKGSDDLRQAEDAISSVETAAAAVEAAAAGAPAAGIDLPDFAKNGADAQEAAGISMLGDVALRVKIELGRTRMYVEDVLRLNTDSVIELDKAAGDPVDIFVNDRHVARGEVLVLNENFCVRVSEIISGHGTGEQSKQAGE